MSANGEELLAQATLLAKQATMMTSQSKELKDLISAFKIE